MISHKNISWIITVLAAALCLTMCCGTSSLPYESENTIDTIDDITSLVDSTNGSTTFVDESTAETSLESTSNTEPVASESITDTTSAPIIDSSPLQNEILPYVTLLVSESAHDDEKIIDYSLQLPELHLSDELDAELMEDIELLFYEPARRNIATGSPVFYVSYGCVLYENILSIQIISHWGFSPNELCYYVNYDVDKKTILTFGDALKIAGFEDSPLLELIGKFDIPFYFKSDGSLIVYNEIWNGLSEYDGTCDHFTGKIVRYPYGIFNASEYID